MNMRKVIFVVALALIIGGGVLYKFPISFAAEATVSARSEFAVPFKAQVASVYTAIQDFWSNLFSSPASEISAPTPQPTKPVVSLIPPKPTTSPPAPQSQFTTSNATPRSHLKSSQGETLTTPPAPKNDPESSLAQTRIITERVLSGVTSADLE